MYYFLARHFSFVLAAVLGLTITGCAVYAADDIIREPHPDQNRHRIDRDVSRFVRNVDRRVGLSARQEEVVYRLLADRTYFLLDNARPSDRRFVYPFPRHDARTMNSVQRKFWRDVDRSIERSLNRNQARRYRDVVVRGADRRRAHVDRRDGHSRDERRGRSRPQKRNQH